MQHMRLEYCGWADDWACVFVCWGRKAETQPQGSGQLSQSIWATSVWKMSIRCEYCVDDIWGNGDVRGMSEESMSLHCTNTGRAQLHLMIRDTSFAREAQYNFGQCYLHRITVLL